MQLSLFKAMRAANISVKGPTAAALGYQGLRHFV
jgi:hypothetical protein